MSHGGGTTVAYRLTLNGGILVAEPTARLRTQCATIDDALIRLRRGDAVTVAGSDMIALRARLASTAQDQAQP